MILILSRDGSVDKSKKLPKPAELPETLYLISDMEFNACVRNASVTNFENAKRRFAAHGYKLPQIVFWNVASRNSNQPVTRNEQGVALVSGCVLYGGKRRAFSVCGHDGGSDV